MGGTIRAATVAVMMAVWLTAAGPARAGGTGTESVVKMEKGYLLVMGSFTDMAKRAAYSAALPPIYAQHGGRYLGVGGPGRGVEVLAGNWVPRGVVFALFGEPTAVQSFWDSPEYRAAVELRRGAGSFDVLRLAGATPASEPGQKVYLLEFIAAAPAADPSAYRAAVTATAAAHGGRVLVDMPAAATMRLEGEAPVGGFSHLLAVELPAAAVDGVWATLRDDPARRTLGGVSTVRLNGLPPG